jgi:hypothetical protein
MVALPNIEPHGSHLNLVHSSEYQNAKRLARRLDGMLMLSGVMWRVYSEITPRAAREIIEENGGIYIISHRAKNGVSYIHIFGFDGLPVDSDMPWREYPCYRMVATPDTGTITRKHAGPAGLLYTDARGSRQALTDAIPVPGVPGLDVPYAALGMADPFQPTGKAVELPCDAPIPHDKPVSDDLTPGALYRTPHFAGRPLPLMSVVTFNDSEWLKFDAGYGGVIHCRRDDVQAVR